MPGVLLDMPLASGSGAADLLERGMAVHLLRGVTQQRGQGLVDRPGTRLGIDEPEAFFGLVDDLPPVAIQALQLFGFSVEEGTDYNGAYPYKGQPLVPLSQGQGLLARGELMDQPIGGKDPQQPE